MDGDIRILRFRGWNLGVWGTFLFVNILIRITLSYKRTISSNAAKRFLLARYKTVNRFGSLDPLDDPCNDEIMLLPNPVTF